MSEIPHPPSDYDRYSFISADELKNIDSTSGEIANFTEKWRGLESAFTDLVRGVESEIRSQRWTGIIAEDRRGRFPAMVMRGIISRAYRDSGSEKALTATYMQGPGEIYIKTDYDIGTVRALRQAGKTTEAQEEKKAGIAETREAYRTYIQAIKDRDPDGRQLLITETINTGQNIIPLAKLLAGADIKFDILTILLAGPARNNPSELNRVINFISPDTNIFIGAGRASKINEVIEDLPMEWGHPGFLKAIGQKAHIHAPEGESVTHRDKPIPVANMDQKSPYYEAWRQASQDVSQEVYNKVFKK